MKKGMFLLLAVLLFACLTVSAGTAENRSPADVRTNLENAGFLVQNGVLYEFDTLRLASEGKVLTVFGNNAGSAYVILNLPPAPEQVHEPVQRDDEDDGKQIFQKLRHMILLPVKMGSFVCRYTASAADEPRPKGVLRSSAPAAVSP